MKAFPGFILIAIALTSQLPHLHGYPNALSKLISIVDTSSTGDQATLMEKTQNASLQQQLNGGFVSSSKYRCPNDILDLNPTLRDLHQYGADFIIELSCFSKVCTNMKIGVNGKAYSLTLCNLKGTSVEHHRCINCMFQNEARQLYCILCVQNYIAILITNNASIR